MTKLFIKLIASLSFLFPLSGKIYECFLFFNELEILKVHLEELYDSVDYFVIAESSQTFSGLRKPFYFEENKEMFAKYMDKIIPIKIDSWMEVENPWVREGFQRNQVLRGLTNCTEDDYVIISDVDEIIKKEKLPAILQSISLNCPIVTAECATYRYVLNRKDPIPWPGSAAAKFPTVRNLFPNKLREMRSDFYVYPDAGWHFNSMGGYRSYWDKIHSFSHYKDFDLTLQTLPNVRRDIKLYPRVPIDANFPKIIQENQEYYEKIGFIDSGGNLYQ